MRMDFPPMREAIVKYQNPDEVDKMLRVRSALDDTKGVLVQTIEQLLERGEKLDDLLDKTRDLSDSSKRFYKEAKKTNSCCVLA
jgi:synaptobrevin homolog YKT6